MMYIDTASYTGCGGHEINEDSFCCTADFFAVADGLGGHINGEEASRCAIDYLKENAHGNYSEETVKMLLEGANSAVFRQAKGAKTTIAVLFTENGVFRYANVGDSRVYIFRNDKLIAMTKDHSVCRAAVDMGTMDFDEIRRSEDRSKLLKVLGNDEKLVVPKGYPTITMQAGDAFLICSDGFWDYVLESEMEVDLLKSDSPQEWLNYMLKRHIAAAMNKGDNYTAICGMVKEKVEQPVPPPQKPASAVLIAAIIVAVIAAVIIICSLFRSDGSVEDASVNFESVTITEEITDTSEEVTTTEEVIETTETVTTTEEVTDTSEDVTTTEEVTEATETAATTEEITETTETDEDVSNIILTGRRPNLTITVREV